MLAIVYIHQHPQARQEMVSDPVLGIAGDRESTDHVLGGQLVGDMAPDLKFRGMFFHPGRFHPDGVGDAYRLAPV